MRLWVVVAVGGWIAQEAPRPGAALVPGLQLTYASGADTQPAWTIDSVSMNQTHEGRSGCSRIVLRTGGPQSETRWLCRAGDTLFTWSARSNRWVPQRPVTVNRAIVVPRAGGGSTRSETIAMGCEAVGTARITTLATMILTIDSAGRPTRTLRESYAPTLATATGGKFDVWDGSGWRTEREFGLVALRYPAGTTSPAEC